MLGNATGDVITAVGRFTASVGIDTTLINASTGFTSSTGYLKIGGAATGFYSPGTSNLATLTVTTISSSGLATLTDLYVPGNTQLGK